MSLTITFNEGWNAGVYLTFFFISMFGYDIYLNYRLSYIFLRLSYAFI